MKKITLILFMLVLVLGSSGGYGYYVYVLDNDDDEDTNNTTSNKNSPIARISPSNPKIQVDDNINFSASDSTDSDGDELTYAWSFEGDSKQYTDVIIMRNYSSAGEFKVNLVVTDSTGLLDETETIVTVVDNYEESFEGNVQEGQSNTITFPVNSGAISLRVNWSLDENQNPPFSTTSPSTVDLFLDDSDGNTIANATDEQDDSNGNDGFWDITDSEALQANGDYELTIDCTNGDMDYIIDIIVRY